MQSKNTLHFFAQIYYLQTITKSDKKFLLFFITFWKGQQKLDTKLKEFKNFLAHIQLDSCNLKLNACV